MSPSIAKSQLADLAIFGGRPIFQEKLHVGRPNIGDRSRFLERVNTILDNCWLTNNGPYVQEFERKLAQRLGVRHCIAVCNGTVGLEIAVRAAGLTGEVIVPSFTFIATAHALQWQGITPVFCDIDPRTHNIDPKRIERLITRRTSGLIGVHLWGRSCDVESLTRIADEHGLTLMFDAAHALGCSYQGRMIGGFGRAEIFSFHATKFFNTSEGGAVATNDDALAATVRLMTNFGFAGYDNVVSIGTNGKMSEISAALGLTSLEQFERVVDVNRSNYESYQDELAGLAGIHLMPYDSHEACNYQYVVLEVDSELAGIDRDQLQHILWAENVLARRYFYPGCHRMEPYRSSNIQNDFVLNETERLSERVLALPTGMSVKRQDIADVCAIIRLVVSHGREARRNLVHERENGA